MLVDDGVNFDVRQVPCCCILIFWAVVAFESAGCLADCARAGADSRVEASNAAATYFIGMGYLRVLLPPAKERGPQGLVPTFKHVALRCEKTAGYYASIIALACCFVLIWHLADNPAALAFVRFWTIADNGEF